jgi:hypothetical protein
MSDEDKALVLRRKTYLQSLGAIPQEYTQWLSKLDKKKQKRIVRSVTRFKHGLHAVAPLSCLGPARCPFIAACPLAERTSQGTIDPGDIKDYPIGLQCVLESEYMICKIHDYAEHLNVDPQNPVEMSIVNELALLDLFKNRALLVLSHGDTSDQGRDFLTVDESIKGFSDNGTPLTETNTKLHPVAEYINSLEKRREKWFDKLMQTRKAQADWAAKMGGGQATSKVLEEIQVLREFIDSVRTNQIDIEDEGIGLDEDWND